MYVALSEYILYIPCTAPSTLSCVHYCCHVLPPPIHSLCSVYIAQFEEYTRPMITHLLLHKVNHWDRCAGHMTIT